MADQRHGIRQVAGRVEMTADGGAHWTEVSALKNDEKVRSFSEILGLAALDASHAAITLHQPQGENGFLSTQDAGATWKFVHLENTFAGMLFTHAGEYWAFGIEYVHREVRGGYEVPAALHSPDGEHWTRGPRATHEFST